MSSNYFVYNDYRDILRDVFEKRVANNPRYSLRAFARDLKIRPSKLSEVLASKHGLTRLDAKPIAKGLKLDLFAAEHFVDLVSLSHCRLPSERNKIEQRIAKRHQTLAIKSIDLDCFAMIADWYHGAIFEYIRLEKRSHLPESIAKALGITKVETEDALRRLERVGLIKKENNHFVPIEKNVFTESTTVPSLMIRRFHRQMIDKAKLSVDDPSMELRDVFSFLFSLRRDQFPLLKAKLRQIQIEMQQPDVELHDKADEVMCFSYQCFPISKGN